MKRWLYFVLCIGMLFAFTTCGDSPESTAPTTVPEAEVRIPGVTEFSAQPSQGLEYEVNEDGVSCTVTGIGKCQDLYIHIGDTIDGYAVTAIGEGAFYRNDEILGVKMGKNMTQVGDYAFFECLKLQVVAFGDALSHLGQYSFAGCTKIQTLTLPETLVQVDGWAFYDCFALESVHVSSLQHWLNISFGGPYANPLQWAGNLYVAGELLTELTIPQEMVSIESWTFAGCTSLTKLVLHESILEIHSRAFSQCENLKEIRYAGTKEQWGAVDKRSYWDFDIDDVYQVYCADGVVK